MVQIIEQSRSEKLKMYMAMQKRKLAEMLINCNEILSKVETCRHMDNIGGCCKTLGHKKCTCVIGGKLSPVA
jgi:hypothetical protein